MPGAEALARKIIANAPVAVKYTMEAIDRYGVARGSVMAIWRLLRCHPLAKGGVDPVVKVKTIRADRFVVPVHSRETDLCSH